MSLPDGFVFDRVESGSKVSHPKLATENVGVICAKRGSRIGPTPKGLPDPLYSPWVRSKDRTLNSDGYTGKDRSASSTVFATEEEALVAALAIHGGWGQAELDIPVGFVLEFMSPRG